MQLENLNLSYSRFLPRALASFIDALILLPFSYLIYQFSSQSKYVFIFQYLLVWILVNAYPVYFHQKYGQTIGKKLLKIKVTKDNLSPLTFQDSFLRSSLDIIFGFVSIAGILIGIYKIPSDGFASLGALQRFSEIQKMNPLPLSFSYAFLIWGFAKIIVLFLNQKRKSIHDFIADTIVIDLKKPSLEEQKSLFSQFFKFLISGFLLMILFFFLIVSFFNTQFGIKLANEFLRSSGKFIQEFELSNGKKFMSPGDWHSQTKEKQFGVITLNRFGTSPNEIGITEIPNSIFSNSEEICSDQANQIVKNWYLDLTNNLKSKNKSIENHYEKLIVHSSQIGKVESISWCHLQLKINPNSNSTLNIIYQDPKTSSLILLYLINRPSEKTFDRNEIFSFLNSTK